MKLADLTPELFERALALYLHHAYPEDDAPASCRLDLTQVRSSDDVLALFVAEVDECPGAAPRRHYVLRLGNDRYPLMKLTLMEFMDREDWFWSVDTHDDAQVEPDSPDWEAWQSLRAHNLRVKERVERAWRSVGIPTARIVARSLPAVDRDGEGPLILVVDDEEGMRSVAVNLLCSAGYSVAEAGSADDAILQFGKRRPDLVLMDYEMPGMNGVDACGRLRELEAEEGQGRRTPILLATAGAFNLAETPGADGFLQKPFQRTVLLSFVAHQLPGKKGRRDRAGDTPGP